MFLQVIDVWNSYFIADFVTARSATYWIGLHDRNSEGQFEWLDDSGAVSIFGLNTLI